MAQTASRADQENILRGQNVSYVLKTALSVQIQPAQGAQEAQLWLDQSVVSVQFNVQGVTPPTSLNALSASMGCCLWVVHVCSAHQTAKLAILRVFAWTASQSMY